MKVKIKKKKNKSNWVQTLSAIKYAIKYRDTETQSHIHTYNMGIKRKYTLKQILIFKYQQP